MAHLIDRHLIERANAAVLLSIVWAALAACVIGAVIYDIASWLGGYTIRPARRMREAYIAT